MLNAGTTGKIVGFVNDKKNGEPLIGANVIVQNTPYGAATDIEGNYYILQLPPGIYQLKFDMIGYQSVVVNEVRVKVDLTTTVNAELNESVVGLNDVFQKILYVDIQRHSCKRPFITYVILLSWLGEQNYMKFSH